MMLNNKDFSAGAIKRCLDKGWAEDEFIKAYGLSGVKELRKWIEVVYKHDKKRVNFIMADMRKNRKKPASGKKNAKALEQLESESSIQVIKTVELNSVLAEQPYYQYPTTISMNNTEKKVEDSMEKTDVTAQETGFEKDQTEVKETVEETVQQYSVAISTDNTEEKTEETLKKPQDEVQVIAQGEVLAKNQDEVKVEETVSKTAEEVEEEIAQTRRKIASFEKAREELKSGSRTASMELQAVGQKLRNLENEILALRAKSILCYETIIDSEEKIAENDAQIEEESNRLSELERQLEELTVKTLYCGDDELPGFDYYLSKEVIETKEVNGRFLQLLANDEFADLLDSVKLLKKVAKISILADRIEKQNKRSVELVFSKEDDISVALEMMGRKVLVIA